MAAPKPSKRTQKPRRSIFTRLVLWCLVGAFAMWIPAAMWLVALRWVAPPFTAVQVQRRVEAAMHGKAYQKRYVFVPIERMSPDFQHAVVAAEDARFYRHHGFDWTEIQNAVDDDLADRRVRGASTITQQLVKNLFFGTGRSWIRKGVEASLVPVAEYALDKRRILELYLNVVEWGPGVYGAEAAAQFHYSTTARKTNREQGERLAAVLPSPLRRKPERMTKYAAIIEGRMREMGW